MPTFCRNPISPSSSLPPVSTTRSGEIAAAPDADEHLTNEAMARFRLSASVALVQVEGAPPGSVPHRGRRVGRDIAGGRTLCVGDLRRVDGLRARVDIHDPDHAVRVIAYVPSTPGVELLVDAARSRPHLVTPRLARSRPQRRLLR